MGERATLSQCGVVRKWGGASKFPTVLSCLLYFFLFFKFLKINLFIYFWLRRSLLLHALSLVAVSGGYSSFWCVGFSLRWLLLSWSTGSRHVGSVVVACELWSTGSVVVVRRLSCSVACGIFPDQGSNPCPLHWQADS